MCAARLRVDDYTVGFYQLCSSQAQPVIKYRNMATVLVEILGHSISSEISNLQSSSKWSTQWGAKIGKTLRNPAVRNKQVLFSSCMRNHPRIWSHKGEIVSRYHKQPLQNKGQRRPKSVKQEVHNQVSVNSQRPWDRGENQEPREDTFSALCTQTTWINRQQMAGGVKNGQN